MASSQIEREPVARKRPEPRPAWVGGLKRFEETSALRATWQVVNSVVPYAAIWALMAMTVRLHLPLWVTLALAVPAAGLLVRIFILFHDCVHGSFVGSAGARRWLGRVLGFLVFTPREEWRATHLEHHSTAGNLDRRGVGDIWTMTLAEYQASSRLGRLSYRAYRHPFVMLGVGPLYFFLVSLRIPPRHGARSRVASVLLTDLALAAVLVAASFTIGLGTYLLVQISILFFAGMGGIWLFYVQHQFDPSYWARTPDWGSMDAALRGSSYYRLPRVLQWFSASIGLHHIHHLRPRIPNYNLQRCLDATPELQLPHPLTLRRSLAALRLNLWDEEQGALVSFRAERRLARLRVQVA